MLDIGIQEVLVLMVIALLVFGPDKLPELGRRLGRAMREFRRASDEFRSTVETNLSLNEESILPPSATPSTPESATAEAGAAPAEIAAPGGGGELAGAAADASGGLVPEAEAASGLPEDPFCSQRGGRLLHRTRCAWVRRIPDAERIAIKTATEGWELGLRPCPACEPGDSTA
jgi:TatA/E family protein of Tat protein translocase